MEYRNVQKNGEQISGEQSRDGESWHRFEACLPLARIDAAIGDWSTEAFRRIWDVQDGYGEPGFIPAQGYDWSGIRDSSSEALAEMDRIAREYVTDDDLAKMFGYFDFTEATV